MEGDSSTVLPFQGCLLLHAHPTSRYQKDQWNAIFFSVSKITRNWLVVSSTTIKQSHRKQSKGALPSPWELLVSPPLRTRFVIIRTHVTKCISQKISIRDHIVWFWNHSRITDGMIYYAFGRNTKWPNVRKLIFNLLRNVATQFGLVHIVALN